MTIDKHRAISEIKWLILNLTLLERSTQVFLLDDQLLITMGNMIIRWLDGNQKFK